jgi:AcrR family transcriptional regulator
MGAIIMPRTIEQNAKIKEARKNQILDKAAKLFALDGYARVTIDDIVAETGCSHGLFYHYFSSKEDVYTSLRKRMSGEEYANYHIPKDEINGKRGYEALQIIVNKAVATMDAPDNIIYYGLILSSENSSNSSLPCDKGDVSYNELFKNLVALIKDGQDEGKVRVGNPEAMARVFIDFCYGAMHRRSLEGQDTFKKFTSEDIMNIFDK